MSDIGVCTTVEVFDHKMDTGYWWFTAATPKVEVGEKFWIAWDGRWQGYSVVFKIEGRNVHFHGFEEVFGIGLERKPFQGFTYKVPKIPPRGGRIDDNF